MQGGGFAGTIQAFVPGMLTAKYHDAIEKVFGAGSCYLLRLREQGAAGHLNIWIRPNKKSFTLRQKPEL